MLLIVFGFFCRSADTFSHSALICLQLCLFHSYPILDDDHLLLLRWIFIVSHSCIYKHTTEKLDFNQKPLLLLSGRCTHVSWNASCRRSHPSLCWPTKTRSWRHWTWLPATQVCPPPILTSWQPERPSWRRPWTAHRCCLIKTQRGLDS